MTRQVPERLIYGGVELALHTMPLDNYFALIGVKLELPPPMSCCWRGYVAHWEIAENRLYLVGFAAVLDENRTATLEDIFPFAKGRVLAGWYSGSLHAFQGLRRSSDMLDGTAAAYAEEMWIDVKRGVVRGTRILRGFRFQSADDSTDNSLKGR